MSYWESGLVVTVLWLAVCLAVAEGLRRAVPALARLGVPGSIVAGLLGLLAGPSVAGVLPMDVGVLESIVYHGLALVFIAVSLKAPAKGRMGPGVASIAFAVPFMLGLQAFLGLGVVMLLGLASPLHPGFGLILPMGFEEGPGQALSLGAAWEAGGMEHGAQVGLIVAALGFAWSIGIGVPLVAWGRRRGLLAALPAAAERDADADAGALEAPGALDALTVQVVAIGGVYLVTYAFIRGLTSLLAGMPGIAAMGWGFHFIFGALFAIFARRLLARVPSGTPLDDALLSRLGGLTVDVVTAAAIAAIQVAVLRAHWVPIALVTLLGGVATLLSALWLARRAFPEAPFEHCVVLFGMSTGTLPTGLALLRIIDPELRSPAPMSAVLGSAGAVAGAAPFFLGIIPFAVAGWPGGYPGVGWTAMAVLAAYLAVVVGLWWKLGPLRFLGPLTRLWPDEPATER